jgi:hypothetical protein
MLKPCRHCEEQRDEAIQLASTAVLDCFASLAMTGDNPLIRGYRNDAKALY